MAFIFIIAKSLNPFNSVSILDDFKPEKETKLAPTPSKDPEDIYVERIIEKSSLNMNDKKKPTADMSREVSLDG